MESERCPGCGLVLEPVTGPTHAYLGASPACWALYGRVLAREFSDLRYARFHGTTVDAYAVQHPGVAEGRTIRSAALHLIRLHLTIELGEQQQKATEVMARVARSRLEFEWLDPPKPNGAITVSEVAATENPDEHIAGVQRWAADVWEAWAAHHERVRQWLKEALA